MGDPHPASNIGSIIADLKLNIFHNIKLHGRFMPTENTHNCSELITHCVQQNRQSLLKQTSTC